jgi:hypothetical protein
MLFFFIPPTSHFLILPPARVSSPPSLRGAALIRPLSLFSGARALLLFALCRVGFGSCAAEACFEVEGECKHHSASSQCVEFGFITIRVEISLSLSPRLRP